MCFYNYACCSRDSYGQELKVYLGKFFSSCINFVMASAMNVQLINNEAVPLNYNNAFALLATVLAKTELFWGRYLGTAFLYMKVVCSLT